MGNARKHRVLLQRQVVLAVWVLITASTSQAQSDAWTEKTPMPTARLGLATCVVDGIVYAIGGYAAAGRPGLSIVEAYDPSTDTWTTKAPMPTSRRWLACSAVDGKIYAIGGFRTEGEPALDTVEAYDVATDTWTPRASLPTARKGLSAAEVGGKIYAVGGAGVDEQRLATVEMYDPATNAWTTRAPLPTARAMLSTSAVDGEIYAIGGPWPGSGGIATVEAYDPATDAWTTRAGMPTARWGVSTTTVEGTIYAVGGASGSTGYAVVEAYDPVTDTWSTRRSLPATARSEAGVRWGLSTGAVDGKLYAFGGATEPFPPHPGSDRVHEYTPASVATGIDDASGEPDVSGGVVLYPPFPNPFTLSTAIRFELSSIQPVRLVVYDVRGRAVRKLVNGVRDAGRYEVVFETGEVPSGMYLYRLETPEGRFTGTMQVVK